MENKVSGQIVRQDNEKGIPNLTVALFDIDTALSNLEVQGDKKTYNDLLRETFSSQASATPEMIRFVLALILGPVDEEDILLRGDAPAGDRLGSVLTDSRGHFDLDFRDDAFNDEKKEKRPDLLLMVFGPDVTTEIVEQNGGRYGLGRPESKRVVHMALFPRWNAGRQEAFYIKIPDNMHELAGIPTDIKGTKFDPDAFLGFLASDEGQDRNEQRKSLAGNIPFALLPRSLAANAQFMPSTMSASEADDLMRQTIISGAVNVGLLTIQPAVVTLTDEELALIPDIRNVSACDVLELKGLGVELSRIRTLITKEKAKKEAAELELISDSDGDDGGDDDGDGGDPDTTDAMAHVTSRILGQIESLPDIQQTGSTDILDDLQKIKDRINELEMSGGPANVTAYRDFHNLQVAFKDVWTAGLDTSLEADVLSLYEEINKVNDEYPNALERPEDVEFLEEFKNYTASVNGALATSSSGYDLADGFYLDFFTPSEWNRLNRDAQSAFISRYADLPRPSTSVVVRGPDGERRLSAPRRSIETPPLTDSAQYRQLIVFSDRLKTGPEFHNKVGRVQRMIEDIGARLAEPYSFKYYAEGSVNYGILVTYRQEWQPLNYQVGRLVSTLPLAPGETRELKITQKHKRTRAEKEMRKSLVENSYEQASSLKSELDVLAKLATDTNFKMTARGSFTLGIGSIESASEFSHNQKAESSRQHKQMSEATRKASEKVRQEREISIETTEEFESGIESTQKISNPNNEVTVTYLMYELERRYRVHQRLERVTPTIMVAMDMPSPNELTEGWVLEHAWILRRALLDDAFEDAINLIEHGRQSEALDIEIKRAVYEREAASLEGINSDFDAVIKDRTNLRNQIINLQKDRDDYAAGEDSTADQVRDFFRSGGLSALFGGDSGPDQAQLYEAMIKAEESRLKHIDEQAEELATAQRAAKREAREAGQQYANVLKSVAQKDTQIKQLLLHLRQNIFHYMHAIWEMKHPDERFFELAEKKVYHIPAGRITCEIRRAPGRRRDLPPGLDSEGETFEVLCGPTIPPDAADLAADIAAGLNKVTVGSIAHIDQLLGFKGNYAIFPLKDCTHYTDHMMQDFVDDYFGVRDPALEMGVTSAELLEYAKTVWGNEGIDNNTLTDLIVRSLSSPVPDTQEITLPTGQIYMEALKGEQALLENFKLAHRGMDVLKVEEEIRHARLENLRLAARMVKPTPNFDDGDVDKVISVTGTDSVIIDSD